MYWKKNLYISIYRFFLHIFFITGKKYIQSYLWRDEHKMRATGIVRRIDDLGRVVIPKEIRKTLRIREGDPLEIFTAKDGEVILKKYSPIGELNEFSQEYAETLGETVGHGVLVTDLDSIIAVSKLPKKDYKEKSISKELEDIIENRTSCFVKDNKIIPIHKDDSMEYKQQIIMPIVSTSGDCIGSIILVAKENDNLTDSDEKLLKVAVNFLGKQVQ
jgi:AbrB family transcriptional regulator, stage V sporulation protein T